jgi:hypothetical protein
LVDCHNVHRKASFNTYCFESLCDPFHFVRMFLSSSDFLDFWTSSRGPPRAKSLLRDFLARDYQFARSSSQWNETIMRREKGFRWVLA